MLASFCVDGLEDSSLHNQIFCSTDSFLHCRQSQCHNVTLKSVISRSYIVMLFISTVNSATKFVK